MLSGQEILQLKLMSYKNKGKTYIRAYRNKWVPATPEEVEKGSKGRSIPDVQIQVGVLQPDGRVKMGKKFLTLHPEFSNQDWYSRLCQPKNGHGLRHTVAGHFKFHFT